MKEFPMRAKIKDQVDLLFKNAPDRHYEIRENPVTGERFVPRLDPIRPHKERAVRALVAQLWFAAQKPPDAPDLPLNYGDREKVRWQGGGLSYLVGAFACSLHGRNFWIEGHPDFDTFARGVMASGSTPDFVRSDPQLLRRYPPKPLKGLNRGLVFDPK
jgi:hypothetical protein